MFIIIIIYDILRSFEIFQILAVYCIVQANRQRQRRWCGKGKEDDAMLACSFVGFHIANKLGTVDGGAANNQLPVVRPAAALMLMRRQGGQLLRGGWALWIGHDSKCGDAHSLSKGITTDRLSIFDFSFSIKKSSISLLSFLFHISILDSNK
jgi:hypothetical protein